MQERSNVSSGSERRSGFKSVNVPTSSTNLADTAKYNFVNNSPPNGYHSGMADSLIHVMTNSDGNVYNNFDYNYPSGYTYGRYYL